MVMKRVTNDRSKYTPRSKIGLKSELNQKKEVDVCTRRKFVVTSDGYFVWGRSKKNKT
jgi:hypothetical protein